MTPPTPGATGGTPDSPTPTPGAAPAGGTVPTPTPTPGAAPAGGQDAGIQAAINAVVARERAEADRRAAELQAKIDQLTAAGATPAAEPPAKPRADDPAYIETIRKPLVDELNSYKARETAREDVTKKAAVKLIAAKYAVDGAEVDVADALVGQLKLTGADTLEVVDAQGRARYGKNGLMTPEELVVEHFKAKPYLAKPTVRSGLGLGATPASADTGTAAVDALRAQITEAEGKQDFVTAGRLKSQLLELTRVTPRR